MADEHDRDRDPTPQEAQRNGQSAISQDNPLRVLHQEGDAHGDRSVASRSTTPDLTDEEVSVLCVSKETARPSRANSQWCSV